MLCTAVIFIFLFPVAMGQKLDFTVIPPTGNDVQINLISDLVAQVKDYYSIAFISSDIENIYEAVYYHIDTAGPFSYNVLTYVSVTPEMIGKLQTGHIKDNIPTLYTVLQTDNVNEEFPFSLIKSIKEVDHSAKIVVISKRNKNPNLYLEQNVYDTYVFAPNQQDYPPKYSVSYICQFCEEGKDVMKLINTWGSDEGFKHELHLTPSFTGSFCGATLTMGLSFRYPNLYVTGMDEAGNKVMDGYNYRDYIVLAGMLRLRWKFYPSSSRRYLRSGKTDVVGGSKTVKKPFSKQYDDVSASTDYFSGYCIISIEPHKGLQHFAIIQPFSWYIWLFVVGCVPAVGVTLYVLKRAERVAPAVRVRLGDCMWYATVVLCWDYIQVRNPSSGVFIVLGSFSMMMMLIVFFYMDFYIAILSASKYVKPPIESFDQLWESDMQVLSWGSRYKRLVKRFGNVADRFVDVEYDKGENARFKIYTMMQESPDDYVLIYRYGYLYNYIGEFTKSRYRKFYKSKESLPRVYASLWYLKSFPYKEYFNRKITLVHAMDITNQNVVKFDIPGEVKWDKYLAAKADMSLITFEHLFAGFMFLLSGYFVAFLVFCLELLVHYLIITK